jgi:hypothetical protein
MGMTVDMNVYTDMMNKTNRIGYTNAYAKLIPFSAFEAGLLHFICCYSLLGTPRITEISAFEK